MADNYSDKKPAEFAAQHQDPENADENAESQALATPQNPEANQDVDRFSSEDELNPVEEAAGSQHDNESVNAPMDTAGMDSVELGSTKEAKTSQPKKKKKRNTKRYSVDYVDRDPENLQEAVKVNFADIIAEPSGAHSFNTIWGTSYKIYSVTKFWVYRIMSLLCGVPCSLFWGIYFACMAFLSIWWVMPCIRAFAIKMNFVGKVWAVCIRTFFDPIFESIGLILSRIRIMLTLRKD